MAQLPCAAEGGPPVSFLARIGVTSVALALGKGPRLGAGPLLVGKGGAAKHGCDGNAEAGFLRGDCAAWYGGGLAAKHGCDKDGGDGRIGARLRRLVRRGAVLGRGCSPWYGGGRAAKHGCDKDGGNGAYCGGIAPRGTEGSRLGAGLRRLVRRGAILRRDCSAWYGGVIFGFGGESG